MTYSIISAVLSCIFTVDVENRIINSVRKDKCLKGALQNLVHKWTLGKTRSFIKEVSVDESN